MQVDAVQHRQYADEKLVRTFSDRQPGLIVCKIVLRTCTGPVAKAGGSVLPDTGRICALAAMTFRLLPIT